MQIHVTPTEDFLELWRLPCLLPAKPTSNLLEISFISLPYSLPFPQTTKFLSLWLAALHYFSLPNYSSFSFFNHNCLYNLLPYPTQQVPSRHTATQSVRNRGHPMFSEHGGEVIVEGAQPLFSKHSSLDSNGWRPESSRSLSSFIALVPHHSLAHGVPFWSLQLIH